MDWISCNLCGSRPPQTKLFVTSCGHLLCVNCLKQVKDGLCLVCKKKFQAEEVNKNMRPELRDLFRTPSEYFNILVKELQSVATFQEKQRAVAEAFHRKRLMAENERINRIRIEECRAKAEVEAVKKRYTDAYEQLKAAKQKKTELMSTLQQLRKHKSEIEKRELHKTSSVLFDHFMTPAQTEPSSSNNIAGFFDRMTKTRAQHTTNLFENTSNSVGDSRIVTSTPIANIDASRKEYMMRMFGSGNINPSPIARQ